MNTSNTFQFVSLRKIVWNLQVLIDQIMNTRNTQIIPATILDCTERKIDKCHDFHDIHRVLKNNYDGNITAFKQFHELRDDIINHTTEKWRIPGYYFRSIIPPLNNFHTRDSRFRINNPFRSHA